MNATKPRVLLADDEQHIRRLIAKVVTLAGFEVVGEAFNGNEAVEAFKKLKPDMVLLDINMPFKTGIEALGEIMALDDSVLAIMLTSVSDVETIEKCAELGAFNYFRKDTPIDDMIQLLQNTWKEWNEEE